MRARRPLDPERPDGELAAWSDMLRALPVPAALVDRDGEVLVVNRWLEAAPGEPLIQPSGEDVAPGLRFGADGTSRWRVRPLDEQATVMLATTEQGDAGDHLLRQFFSTGESLFVVYDQWGRIVESNAAWENMLGYSHDEVFGTDSWTLLPPDDLTTREAVERELREQGRSEPTFKMRTASGTYRDVKWALHYDHGFGRCFGVGRDVTEEGRLTAELHRRAYTDELTGLANRASLLEDLDRCLEGPGNPSVLFCDLDRFKIVNDSLGHRAGDELLIKLAGRLRLLSQDANVLIGRLGGDEFVGVLRNADLARAIVAAEDALAAMAEPFIICDRPVYVSMSIGIASASPGQTISAESLLGQADTAAYKAKQNGRHGYVVFDESLRATVDRRFNVEADLRLAIERGDLEAHYQPIVRLPGGGVVGMEALVRWRTEHGRIIGPGEFLDVAEDAGLMPEIGDLVLGAAVELGAELAESGRPIIVSVNVSPAELAAADYRERVLDRVAAAGLDPTLLLLEITESAVINTDSAVPTLEALRAVGIRIGLDDFGTGFSSLAHLRTLPIDVVKVDRSFVPNAVDDDVTGAVTASLIDLCRALGLEVILEGVETTDQASIAERLGGEVAQGFLFHRPMPADDLRRLLGRDRPTTRPTAATPRSASELNLPTYRR